MQWALAVGAALALQTLFFFVERRCSSPQLTYHRGLLVVGASVSTGWTYFDPFLILGSVASVHLISCGLALFSSAPMKYARLVHWFHRNKVER